MRRYQSHRSAASRDQRAHGYRNLQSSGAGARSRLVEKMKRKTYTARSQRIDDWWAISVPELSGVHTQARRLAHVESMIRDAIALFLDVPADSFDVVVEPVLPGDLQKKIGRARRARSQADLMQREAVTVSAEVAADLVNRAHLTVRDAGRVLGVSHQRIAQLLKPPRRPAAPQASPSGRVS